METTTRSAQLAGATSGPWAVHPRWPGYVVPAADVDKLIGGASDPEREAASYAKVIVRQEGSDRFPEFSRSRLSVAEAKANAHLIAAAPELLAALKELTGECARNHNDPCGQCVYCEANAAIAKAEGRS